MFTLIVSRDGIKEKKKREKMRQVLEWSGDSLIKQRLVAVGAVSHGAADYTQDDPYTTG